MIEPEGHQPAAPNAIPDALDGVQDADWQVIPDTDTPHPEDLQRALASSERQLAEARLQITELESLLQDLPEIFERKFVQRLQPVLERQEQLLADNRELQHQIRRLAPAPGEVRLRFNPEAASGGAVQLPQLPQPASGHRQGWGERIGRRRRAA